MFAHVTSAPNNGQTTTSDLIVTTQADVASHFDVERSTVLGWRRKGMPGQPKRYDLGEISTWLKKRGLGPNRKPAIEDEDLTGPSDSPGLERYRLAKAKLAEIELAKQQGSVVSREVSRDILGRIASLFRRYGERLSKRHGPEEAKLFNEVLENAQQIILKEFGDKENVG